MTRFQMHKCSAYCRQKRKHGGYFVTKCRFNFPRSVAVEVQIDDADCTLKTHSRFYQLVHYENEWLQSTPPTMEVKHWHSICSGIVTGSSALCSCLCDNNSIYSRLWSLVWGVYGHENVAYIYEASDILLSDHLCKTSVQVKWIDVSLPHKRSHRLKNTIICNNWLKIKSR